jgi:hypothetical protein
MWSPFGQNHVDRSGRAPFQRRLVAFGPAADLLSGKAEFVSGDAGQNLSDEGRSEDFDCPVDLDTCRT